MCNTPSLAGDVILEEEERIYAMRKKRRVCVLLGRGGEDICAMRKRRRGYML